MGIPSSLYGNLFDDKFHKIQVFFDTGEVVVLVDCVQVARLKLPPVTGVSPDAKVSISGGMTVQDMAIVCGHTDAEECCELPEAPCYGFGRSTHPGSIMGGSSLNGNIDNCVCRIPDELQVLVDTFKKGHM